MADSGELLIRPLTSDEIVEIYEVWQDGINHGADYWTSKKVIDWCLCVTGTIRHLVLFLVLVTILKQPDEIFNGIVNFLQNNCGFEKSKIKKAVVDQLTNPNFVSILNNIIKDWESNNLHNLTTQEFDDLFKDDDDMNEAIEKHNELNQKIFDGMELRPEVKEKVQDITNTFLTLLAENEITLKVRDVILTGSNASYNYTKDSDIDVHILANTRDLDDPQKLYPKLYDAYRRIFENKFDISFYGIPVETYVEIEDNPVVSNGIYSIMYDCWIKKPTEGYVKDVDQEAINKAAEPWIKEAEDLIENGDVDAVDDYITRLYEMRQKGIYNTEGSEFSDENLIFKEVRNAGLLDKLKELKNELISKDLSLESLEEDLSEPERRDFVHKIVEITHIQPVVHPNGIFEVNDIRNEEVDYLVFNLKRKNWVEYVSKIPGRFDFNHVSGFGLPSRYWTIRGKLRYHKEEQEFTR